MSGGDPDRERDAGSGESPFRAARKPSLLARAVPVSKELPRYRLNTGRRDAIAAATVAAVALPSAMAYAEVAGLSPVNGLYALLLPAVLYALLGSSRQLVIGPEGSISALVAASVLGLAAAGSPEAAALAAALALLVAACFVVARVARLGWIADYFSRSVLIGYIHGVAVVLVIGQLGKVLGVDVEAADPIPQLVEVLRELGDIDLATLAVGAGALLVLLPLRFLAPRFPAPLVVVVAGIALSSALALADHGVATVGAVPSGLPELGLPDVSAADTLELVPAAVGLFLVAFADAILTARSYAGKHGQHVTAGQELLALGGANAAAGLSQGFPVGASGSRTAVSDGMGVRTQLGAGMAAGVILLILLFLTGPIADLPKAVLGATIISAAIGLVDVAAWRALGPRVGRAPWPLRRRLGEPHRAGHPWRGRLPPRRPPVLRERRLRQGRVLEAVRGASTQTRWVVFDGEGLADIDSSGIAAVEELIEHLRKDAITLVTARLKSHILQRFDESGLTRAIGPGRAYPTVRAAVDACAGGQPLQPA